MGHQSREAFGDEILQSVLSLISFDLDNEHLHHMLVFLQSVFSHFECLLQRIILSRVRVLIFIQFFDVAKHFHSLPGAFAEHEVVISDEVHH